MNTKKTRWFAAGLLAFALSGCGSGDGSSSSSATNGGNTAPVADAGEDQSSAAGDTVTLSGSASDPDGDTLSISWAQDSGPAVDLQGAGSLRPSFEAPDVGNTTELVFTLTVTDPDGASDSDSTTVTVTPAVSLSGRVFDGPIPDATVTVTVGDETFTAEADADGFYTIKVSSLDPEAMVTITATGAEGQETVELLSIAGSFGALREAAGDDGTVDADEAPGVEVSHLSTAKSVLIIEANGGEAPADQATLEARERDVDTEELLDLAVAIKLVIDEGEALPEGTGSTLELVQDQEALETFQAGVDPEAADAVAEQVIATQAADSGYTADEIVDDAIALYLPFRHNAISAHLLEFEPDGTGRFVRPGGSGFEQSIGSVSMTWSITEGVIDVILDEPEITEFFCFPPEGTSSVLCRSSTTAVTLKRVLRGAVSDSVVLTEATTLSYPDNPEIESESVDGSATYSTVRFDKVLAFDAASLEGRTVALNCCSLRTDLLVSLGAGGSGMDLDTGEALTWAVIDGLLDLGFSDGSHATIFKLRVAEGGQFEAFAIVETAEGLSAVNEGLVAVSDGETDQIQVTDLVGRLVQFGGPNLSRNSSSPGEFGWELAVDGSGTNFSTDPDFPREDPMGWELSTDAEIGIPVLIIRRCHSAETSEWIVPTSDADLTIESCGFHERRAWRLISFDGDFLYINSQRDTVVDTGNGSTFESSDQLTRFYSFEPAETAKAGMSTGRGGLALTGEAGRSGGRDLLITLFDEGPVTLHPK